MLKKLAIGAVVALAALTMVTGEVIALPPPPPGWGPPPPPRPPGWHPAPGFNIYIGPGPMMGPPPPFYVRRPPPPMYVRPPAMYCNYDGCAARYRSFDPRDCTYQPYYGPRQYCPL